MRGEVAGLDRGAPTASPDNAAALIDTRAARISVREAFFLVLPHPFVAHPYKTHVRSPNNPIYQANAPTLLSGAPVGACYHSCMTWGWVTITTAVVTFAATNIDDIVILMLFFSQTSAAFRRRHIVVGQYLGFAALVAVSLVGFVSSFLVPRPWIGLLGLAPILLGLRKLIQRADDTKAETDLGGGRPAARAPRLLERHTFSVAAVTIANGGDNIGIYVPLFASTTVAGLVVILVIFFLMVGVWCVLGYSLTRQPEVARVLTRYGHVLVPLVLIGLGVYILIESGTLTLLSNEP